MSASPVDGSDIVEIGSKLKRRFYEPIVLLECLGRACREKSVGSSWGSGLIPYPFPASGSRDTSERALHLFINKLAHVCDSAPGGSTVTAFAILNEPDKVDYVFASNDRKAGDIVDTQEFVKDLLKIVKDGPSPTDGKKRELHRTVMRMVLAFHIGRISLYVRKLASSLQDCLDSCDETSDESKSFKTTLAPLLPLATAAQAEPTRSDKYISRVESLVNSIHNIFRGGSSSVVSLISKRAQTRRWDELNHFAGRLGSYVPAAWTIVQAEAQWPALFDEFEVIGIPSSTPVRNPLNVTTNASEIIGRMTSDKGKQTKYRSDAEFMQKFGLDDNIQRVCSDTNFKPRVHCEVLLHDWLQRRPGGIRPDMFFENSKYIGASKPTCRLCARYFSCVKSSVAVRESHDNLYINWRMPDVFKSQGAAATKERERIMNAMTENVRREAFQMMVEKTPVYKERDSVTWSEYQSNMHPVSLLGSGTGSLRQAGGAPSIAPSAGIDEIVTGTKSLKLVNDATGETMEIKAGWRIQSSQHSSGSSIGVQDSVSQVGEVGEVGEIRYQDMDAGRPGVGNQRRCADGEEDDDDDDIGGGAML